MGSPFQETSNNKASQGCGGRQPYPIAEKGVISLYLFLRFLRFEGARKWNGQAKVEMARSRLGPVGQHG